MEVKFFVIPVPDCDTSAEEINKFLRSVKTLEIKKEFVFSESGSFWTLCVTYLPMQASPVFYSNSCKGKTDYKNILTTDEFEKFTKLRKIRKNIADEDAVPAFAVFTDAELAALSRSLDINIIELGKVEGVGKRKIEKYGKLLIEAYNQELKLNETPGVSV